MAVAAETNKHAVNPETEFGHSLATIAEAGRLMCAGAGVELENIEDELWRDFMTGVQENIVVSDQEVEDPAATALRERLRFEPMFAMEKRDGKTVTKDGRTLESLCEKGAEAARAKAAEDERMQSEVERAENDVWITGQVDSLQPGEMLAVASMEPRDAMDRDGDEYWRKVSTVGYTRGLAVLQVYYCESETKVLAGAYSVKGSSKAAFQKLLAEHNVDVPADTPANQWITHPIRKQDISPDNAKQFGVQLHDRYQQIIDRQVQGVSVTKLIHDNEPIVRAYFNVYMKALARAYPQESYPNGRNNDTLRELAHTLLQSNAELFGPNDRRQLINVANTTGFSIQDAKFMERVIRGACAEEMWNILLHPTESQTVLPPVMMGQQLEVIFHARAATRLRTMLVLGRGGGGCNGLRFERPEGSKAIATEDDLGQQDVFGGNANENEDTDSRPLACVYIHDQCYCSTYDDFSNPINTRKLVAAYRDREGTATCLRPNCGACIDKDNNVIFKGNIWELAQEKASVKAAT